MKIRKRYFIHPSSQIKYISFAVLPALFVSLCCSYWLIEGANTALRSAMEKSLEPIYSTKKRIENFGDSHSSAEALKIAACLEAEIAGLKEELERNYTDMVASWVRTGTTVYVSLLFSLLLVGVLALLYSHRIAGPLFRIKRCLDSFTVGKDTGSIKLRKHDEFKDLAASLERLRTILKEKGVLEVDNG